MRLLVDAQLPVRLVPLLIELGHDVVHTSELPNGNRTPDRKITRIAEVQDRIVVTKDRDFVDGHLLSGRLDDCSWCRRATSATMTCSTCSPGSPTPCRCLRRRRLRRAGPQRSHPPGVRRCPLVFTSVARRSARRDVEAASDVLDVATDRLTRAEELATPTRGRVNELRSVIDDHHRMDSTRRMFDDFNDLAGVAHDAGRLCRALDQWKHWTNGRIFDNIALAEIAATLRNHDDRPGVSQLAAPLAQWAQQRGL